MLSIALQTIRTRWAAFVGTFTALVLGVGLVATVAVAFAAAFDVPELGPQRFSAAPVVVQETPHAV